MKKITVLFDLDDTLIADFSTKFMPEYIKALGDWIKSVPPEKVVPGIRNATKKMMVKQKAAGTLEERFNWYFYSLQGLSKKDLSPVIDSFYQTRFPELRCFLKPIPGIIKMMEDIREMGHDIAIATNPLFPRVATLNRVLWAGFSEDDIKNFKLVSTYENFHFCKPNPAYYAEVLGRMGWKDQPVVMIGDSLDMDIKPAEDLGFSTYWVDYQETSNGRNRLSSGGNRNDIPAWIAKISSEINQPSNNPTMIQAVLNSTPAVFDGFIRSTENINLEKINHIIAELFDRNVKALQSLSEDLEPDLPVEVEEEIVENENYLSVLSPELRRFVSSRQKLLGILKNIPTQVRGNVDISKLMLEMVEFDRKQIKNLIN